ncbi:unnamed protein product [Schistosoma margrebowiei]|uniref:Ferritin n=1 Tax=Schistosoma margrebowiei TaxID=48269 RepID=A0A183MJ57_9TREM|nr:unnamed protein product [Schistosoma margrebowiei]
MIKSRAKHNFAKECEDAINKQINVELQAAYDYMAFFTYFDRDYVSFPKAAEFFRKASHEKREHAEKLAKYQNKRGGRVQYSDIQCPTKTEFTGLEDAMDTALSMETAVNEQQIQEKVTSVAAASAAVRLNIHKGKSKILRFNTTYNSRITLDGEDLEDVKTFTYLSSIIDEHGASDADMNTRIGKARAAYLQLKNIWNSQQLPVNQYQDPSGGRNREEALEVDKTNIKECTKLRRKASPHMESSRLKEKRTTKEYITPRNGDRPEKNVQESGEIRTEGSGKSELKNAWSAAYAPLGLTGSLLKLHEIAVMNNDPALTDFIESQYLHEQEDAIKRFTDYLTETDRVGSGLGQYLFDKITLKE